MGARVCTHHELVAGAKGYSGAPPLSGWEAVLKSGVSWYWSDLPCGVDKYFAVQYYGGESVTKCMHMKYRTVAFPACCADQSIGKQCAACPPDTSTKGPATSLGDCTCAPGEEFSLLSNINDMCWPSPTRMPTIPPTPYPTTAAPVTPTTPEPTATPTTSQPATSTPTTTEPTLSPTPDDNYPCFRTPQEFVCEDDKGFDCQCICEGWCDNDSNRKNKDKVCNTWAKCAGCSFCEK